MKTIRTLSLVAIFSFIFIVYSEFGFFCFGKIADISLTLSYSIFAISIFNLFFFYFNIFRPKIKVKMNVYATYRSDIAMLNTELSNLKNELNVAETKSANLFEEIKSHLQNVQNSTQYTIEVQKFSDKAKSLISDMLNFYPEYSDRVFSEILAINKQIKSLSFDMHVSADALPLSEIIIHTELLCEYFEKDINEIEYFWKIHWKRYRKRNQFPPSAHL